MIGFLSKARVSRSGPIVSAASSMLAVRIALCLAAIWTIFALIAIETRSRIWAGATSMGGDVATLVQSAIAREFQTLDLSITSLATDSVDPTILSLPARLRDKALYDQSAQAPDIGRLIVLDRQGRVVAS